MVAEPVHIAVLEVAPRPSGLHALDMLTNTMPTAQDHPTPALGLHALDMMANAMPTARIFGAGALGLHAFDMRVNATPAAPDLTSTATAPTVQDLTNTVAVPMAQVLTNVVVEIPAIDAFPPHFHDAPPDHGPDVPGPERNVPAGPMMAPMLAPKPDHAMPAGSAFLSPLDVALLSPGRVASHSDAVPPPSTDVAAPAVSTAHTADGEAHDQVAVQNAAVQVALPPRPTSVVCGEVPTVRIHAPAPGDGSIDAPAPGVAEEAKDATPAGVAPGAEAIGVSVTKGETPAASPAPRGSGLMAEVLPFDPTAIEQSVARFLGQFEELGSPVETPPSLVPTPLLVVAVAASFEASRRWLVRRRKDEEGDTQRERGLAFYGFS
jgi:hypothetical protein